MPWSILYIVIKFSKISLNSVIFFVRKIPLMHDYHSCVLVVTWELCSMGCLFSVVKCFVDCCLVHSCHSQAPILFLKLHIFYRKPSSRPGTRSFLIFGHILVLKVSLKFLNVAN